MEARKITVISEAGNGHYVIMTGAETLGELKQDLDAKGIDYTDKTFREGLSRTELIDNSSALPKDVNYRGNITNELVFTLTTTNKKIKSGAMSRIEAYATIKQRGLQADIVAEFGRNFTQVPTAQLVEFLSNTSTTAPVQVPVSDSAAPSPSTIDERLAILEETVKQLKNQLDGECCYANSGLVEDKEEDMDSPYSKDELLRLMMR